MPQPSKIDCLPADVRAQLDGRLRADAYGHIVETAAWLVEQGF